MSKSVVSKRTCRSAAIAAATAFAALCPAIAMADASNGVLRVGSSFSCSSLNPYTTTQSSCLAALRLVYPSLGQPSGTEILPDLATAWSSDDTGQEWTFDITPDARWSDGTPLTARDAAFTINMVLQHLAGPTARRGRTIKSVEGAEAVNDTTLVVRFSKPTANPIGRLAQLIIVPQHIWEPLAEGDGTGITTYADSMPVAGGPFTVAKFSPDEVLLLQKNPDYFGAPSELNGIGIQFFADSTSMVSALMNDQLDVVTPLPATSAEAVEKAGFNVANYPGLRFHSWLFNSSENQKGYPEIRDPLLREAFETAIDRDKIAQVAYLGYATPGDSLVPKVTGAWSNPNVTGVSFDLEKANALLDEAGYEMGPDGLRVANGHPMRYDVLIPSNVEGAEGMRALEIVTEDFQKIGVELVTVQSDNATIADAITGPDNTFANATIAQWGWIPQMDPDFILSVVLCSQIGGLSETAYCNPDYDALYEQQAQEVDTAARQEIVWEMQEILARDRPYIVTVQHNNVEAYAPEWSGFIESPIGFLDYTSNQTFLHMKPAE